MGNEAQVVSQETNVSEQNVQPENQSQEQAVNWQEKYSNLEKEHYKTKADYEQAMRIVQNTESFFNTDKSSYERLNAWINGKPLEDSVAKVEKHTKDTPSFDAEALEQKILQEVESRMSGSMEAITSIQAEKDKRDLQSKYAWLDDAKYKEFEDKFDKEVRDKANELTSLGVPPKKAYESAIGKYSALSQEDLLFKFMRDDMLTQAANAGRKPATLPHGMTGKIGNASGPEPALLEQAKKAYNEVQGRDPDTVATVVTKYAEQLGMKAQELYKLLNE